MVQLSRPHPFALTRCPVLGMAAAILLSTTSAAWAQTAWSNKPVKILRAFVTSGTAIQLAGKLSKTQTDTFMVHSTSLFAALARLRSTWQAAA